MLTVATRNHQRPRHWILPERKDLLTVETWGG